MGNRLVMIDSIPSLRETHKLGNWDSLFDEDLDELMANSGWLFEGFMAQKSLGVLSGDTNIGKTSLAFEMSLALAAGNESVSGECLNLSKKMEGGKEVIYVAAEGSRRSFSKHARGFVQRNQDWDFDASVVMNNLHFCIDTDAKLVGTTPSLGEIVSRRVSDYGLSDLEFVVFDTLPRLAGWSNANSEAEAASVIEQAEWVNKEFDCAVLLVCHYSKQSRSDGGGGAGLSIRGSSFIADAVSSVVTMTEPPSQAKGSSNKREEHEENIRERKSVLFSEKQREMERGQKFECKLEEGVIQSPKGIIHKYVYPRLWVPYEFSAS